MSVMLVKTIALEVGYRQTSDLTRAMAARFGATPTALRAGSGGAAPDDDA
jgi:AraC-like DNA-binding protein